MVAAGNATEITGISYLKKQVELPTCRFCFVNYFSAHLNTKTNCMKRILTLSNTLLVVCGLLCISLLTNCTRQKGDSGYTGEIKDPRAKTLVSICHFIPADSIKTWTARYQRDSIAGKLSQDQQPAMSQLLRNSSSFNSCIIRELINNKESIGLRVLYGLSTDGKLHVILVGIKPDYSDLYVKVPAECCTSGTMMDKALNSPSGLSGGNGTGGAEYGQMP